MREAFVSLQSLRPVSKTRQVSPRLLYRVRALERPLSQVSMLEYSPSTSTTTTTLTTTTLRPSSLSITNDLDSVLSNTDIGVGIILAFLLASLALYLQSQRLPNDFVGGPPPHQEEVPDDGPSLSSSSSSSSSLSTVNATNTTFDEWKEMSRPDNYVWYNTRLRQKNNYNNNNKANKQANTTDTSTTFATEQTWVLITLVVLFAPIFSFEFFLALSRQVACAFFNDSLCLPYLDNNNNNNNIGV